MNSMYYNRDRGAICKSTGVSAAMSSGSDGKGHIAEERLQYGLRCSGCCSKQRSDCHPFVMECYRASYIPFFARAHLLYCMDDRISTGFFSLQNKKSEYLRFICDWFDRRKGMR